MQGLYNSLQRCEEERSVAKRPALYRSALPLPRKRSPQIAKREFHKEKKDTESCEASPIPAHLI